MSFSVMSCTGYCCGNVSILFPTCWIAVFLLAPCSQWGGTASLLPLACISPNGEVPVELLPGRSLVLVFHSWVWGFQTWLLYSMPAHCTHLTCKCGHVLFISSFRNQQKPWAIWFIEQFGSISYILNINFVFLNWNPHLYFRLCFVWFNFFPFFLNLFLFLTLL